MATTLESGAFMEKFVLQPNSSSQQLPLVDLLLLLKKSDGTGCSQCLRGSINGEDIHYGTPTNPCAPDRVPGGSSSGSAVAVGTGLVEFSLETDMGESVRVPASYCGILGFRPSLDVISTSGVIPMSQSFDTVEILQFYQVGRVLLHLPNVEPVTPSQIIIPEDCFSLSSILEKHFGGQNLEHVNLGEYEFKKNHAEWITTVNPKLVPGISEHIWDSIRTLDENIDVCHSMRTELCTTLTDLLKFQVTTETTIRSGLTRSVSC
ncbi:hypothetical protein V6N13_014511 [Hibiscus sabdariffa]